MTCPNCHATTRIEIDTHADGFAANLQECGDCGTLWTIHNDQATVLQNTKHPHGEGTWECPICHSTTHVEVSIHADGFASNLGECGMCGALWSQDGQTVRLVHGATWG